MKISLFILAHDRPLILNKCLESLTKNQIPKEIFILKDKTTKEVDIVIEEFESKFNSLINKIIIEENPRIKNNIFYSIYERINNSDIDYVGFIESDYVFRNDYLEDILNVFNNNKNTLSIAGYNHPDTYDNNKNLIEFPKICEAFFKKDICNRQFLYKKFDQIINNIRYTLQGISNHCGCHFLNIKIFNEVFKNKLFYLFLDFITQPSISGLCDGRLSAIYCSMWENWAEINEIETDKNFAILDICDYSIANHYGCGGISVTCGVDGQTLDWISSPTWRGEDFKRD